MRLSTIKNYRKSHRLLSTLIDRRPMFLLGLDLPFVIVTAVSLKNAAAISIGMLAVHMAAMISAVITCRFLPFWARLAVNTAVSTMAMVLVRYFVISPFFPAVINSAGIYVFLLAVNGMTVLQAGLLTKRRKIPGALLGGLLNALVFSLIMFLAGMVREYFGNNTLWEVPLPAPVKLAGILTPFFGFILVGFFLAGVRCLGRGITAMRLSEAERSELQIIHVNPQARQNDH